MQVQCALFLCLLSITHINDLTPNFSLFDEEDLYPVIVFQPKTRFNISNIYPATLSTPCPPPPRISPPSSCLSFFFFFLSSVSHQPQVQELLTRHCSHIRSIRQHSSGTRLATVIVVHVPTLTSGSHAAGLLNQWRDDGTGDTWKGLIKGRPVALRKVQFVLHNRRHSRAEVVLVVVHSQEIRTATLGAQQILCTTRHCSDSV